MSAMFRPLSVHRSVASEGKGELFVPKIRPRGRAL